LVYITEADGEKEYALYLAGVYICFAKLVISKYNVANFDVLAYCRC